ncbi:hypothetical protein F5884DRAFT_748434 [Xylogone sp. PMI_703]|nr:hypothetical protein F5884DRAFT_748434 [Xylogone sp. PMI_703]
MLPRTKLAIPFSLLLPLGIRALLYTVPNSAYDGPVTIELNSGPTTPDSPKVHPYPNASSYDGTYWDVVSTSSANESFALTAFLGLSSGFPFGDPDLLIGGLIGGTFANGTASTDILSADASANVTVVSLGDSTFGDFGAEGVWWESTLSNGKYVVHLDIPSYEISGKVTLSTLSFTGIGFEDRLFGDTPLLDSLATWYWGHARFGPFSIVWLDALSVDGTESSALKVRPFGGNSAYPPTETFSNPEGFSIVYDLGDHGILEAKVTIGLQQVNTTTYARYTGPISGRMQGGKTYSGKAFFEQYRII